MVTVRTATADDLERISQTHIRCFPNSLSSQMGEKLLQKYYWEFMKEDPELFVVADNGDDIVGFCMGYLCNKSGFKKNYVSNNIFALALRCVVLAISGNRVFYKRISQKFSTKNNANDDEIIVADAYDPAQKGDLLSICLDSSLRGTGIAKEMLSEYEDRLRHLDRKLCLLSVENNNSQAIRFYEKNGYIVYKKYGESLQYGKAL